MKAVMTEKNGQDPLTLNKAKDYSFPGIYIYTLGDQGISHHVEAKSPISALE